MKGKRRRSILMRRHVSLMWLLLASPSACLIISFASTYPFLSDIWPGSGCVSLCTCGQLLPHHALQPAPTPLMYCAAFCSQAHCLTRLGPRRRQAPSSGTKV